MIDIDDVIKEISERTTYDKQIIDYVCKHVFKMTTQIMQDDSDYHDILFNKLFKFKLKNRFKFDKTIPNSPKL